MHEINAGVAKTPFIRRANRIKEHLLRSFAAADCRIWPYRHWRLHDVLPQGVAQAITRLPFAPACLGDTEGQRATHNSRRVFFSADNSRSFALCRQVAEAFSDEAVLSEVQSTCGITLCGSFLRIEYCQDSDGFWLEPHTDIGAKLWTMQVYLSRGPGAADWGTDLLDAALNLVETMPAPFNSALVFVPGADTWHAFHKRPIVGLRKSIIINYVDPAWRSRHELVSPNRPIAATFGKTRRPAPRPQSLQ